MNLAKTVGARLTGFSHIDNILHSLAAAIRTAAPDGGRVLDVGCGEMHISAQLATELGSDYDVVAADINPVKLRHPTKPGYSPAPNLHPAAADATELPFATDTFDVVYSTSFFSHVRSHDDALDEQIRVARPGGQVVVVDENLSSPYQLYKWLSSLGPSWALRQSEPRRLEVRGFEYVGTNENHYTPRYWRSYISAHDRLRLDSVSSPRVECDRTLGPVFAVGPVARAYTWYETHTIAAAEVMA